MKTLHKLTLLGILACSTLSAHAHRMFLVPSATVVSGNAPWVTIDAAAATNVFEFDHVALKLDTLQITGPDGQTVKPENSYSGRFRSSFDVPLTQAGSYKVSLIGDNYFASYKENGEIKRWRGSAAELAKAVPANASELQVSQRSSRVETFITNGKPGGKALTVTGKGLELAAVTHPNDLVSGENASFQFLLDGKPAAHIKLELIPGGLRYRQKLNSQTYTTDDQGRFNVRWPQPGLYWLSAEAKDDHGAVAPATTRTASYIATLEVLPE